MSINEADLPTSKRTYGVSVSYPQSHVVHYEDGVANIVTGPRGEQGEQGEQGDQGIQGIPGQDAQWESMTQAEFNAIPVKDPDTLYVIMP